MKVIIAESLFLVVAILLLIWSDSFIFFLLYHLLMLLITITFVLFCTMRKWKRAFNLCVAVYLVSITFYAFGIKVPPRLVKFPIDYNSQSITESKAIRCFISEYRLLKDSLPANCTISFSEVFTEWRHSYIDSYSRDFSRQYDLACFYAKIDNFTEIKEKGFGKKWAITSHNIKGMMEMCQDDSFVSFYVNNRDTLYFDIIDLDSQKSIGYIIFERK